MARMLACKQAAQAVCNAYENSFSDSAPGLSVHSPLHPARILLIIEV